MNTTELTPKQTQAQQSENLRTILFGIVAAVIFLLWGMRVYADDTVTMYPGENKSISLEIFAPSPETNYPKAVVVKGSKDSNTPATGITASIPGEGLSFSSSGTHVSKVDISVTDGAEPGIYTIRIHSSKGFYSSKAISLTILDPSTGDTPQTGASTETPVVYVPKTPAELYAESLDMLFPSGHTFVTLGEKECIWVIDTDRNTGSLWQAGAKIGSFSVQAADGSVKKLYMYEPIRTADGKVYLQVGVNTNDGQSYDLVISDADREAFKQMGLTGICVNKKYIDL